jgi:transposase
VVIRGEIQDLSVRYGASSRMTWEFIRQPRGRLWVEFLPGYAPELNPVEYLWSHWKQHELPNFCPQNVGQWSQYARKALRRMRQRPALVIAFWRQAVSIQQPCRRSSISLIL